MASEKSRSVSVSLHFTAAAALVCKPSLSGGAACVCAMNIDLCGVHYVLGSFPLMQFNFTFFFLFLQQPVPKTKAKPAARVHRPTTPGLTRTARTQNHNPSAPMAVVNLTACAVMMIAAVQRLPH